jgi:hypothetical protein
MAAGSLPETLPEEESAMKLNRIAAATVTAAAAIALVSGAAVTHHSTAPLTLTADSHSALAHSAAGTAVSRSAVSHPATPHPAAAKPAHLDPSLAWLVSRGGQAQVVFNHDVSVMAADLQIESHDDSIANHLAFEADARVVRTQAHKILSTRALLPTHNRPAYKQMLNDFIVVANLLQPGPGYGTTPQDYTAWNTALKASNITVW